MVLPCHVFATNEKRRSNQPDKAANNLGIPLSAPAAVNRLEAKQLIGSKHAPSHSLKKCLLT